MKLSRPLALTLALLTLLLVLAGGWWGTSGHRTPPRVVQVGLYENPPKVYTATNGHPAGLFIDILEAIAAREGWRLDYRHCDWARCLEWLEQGKIDLMPDVAFSVERARLFDFHTVSVVSSWSQIFAHPALKAISLADLSGKRIAVLEGGIQEDSFAKLMAGFNHRYQAVRVKSMEQAYTAVLSGEADAVLASTFFAASSVGRHRLAETPIVFQPANLYFATAKGHNTDLLARIDTHLDAWRHDSGSIYFDALRHAMVEPPPTAIPAWAGELILALGALLTLFIGVSLLLRWQVAARTAELESQSGRLNALVQSIPDLVWVKSPEGTYQSCNAATELFLGRKASDIIGHPDDDFFDPATADRFRASDRQAVLAGAPQCNEDRLPAIDGEVRVFETIKTAIFDKGGTLTGVLGVARDITGRRRAENELALANARLHALSVRLLEIQEDERRTLASELHDEIGQSLTALKITLQSLGVRPETAPMQKQIALAVDITDTALRQVRQMSLDLRPPQLDDLGLPAAIRWNLDRQCQLAGLLADFNTDDIPARLPEPVAITCYRISQEAITNVIRHAHARTIRVRLSLAQGNLCLEIADDGSGMPVLPSNGQGMGLASMQERAALAGGTLEILAANPGTLVRATFPLSNP